MAKLTRYLQKIFANDSNRVGVFGTGVNKETSKNVETLQSADYENGWSAAIVTNKNYPIWQERDGVDYGLSYQIKYLDQMGVAEWIATETYYTTSYCQYNGGIYRSKIDDNTGNMPIANTSNEYWQFLGRDFLNTQQVTNCLLEVPNRINYTLINGELTLKAGSVAIVPYGTTDLSSTYPVGATFINDNLKVYDTYWDSTNNQFFVWAELQNDVVRASTTPSGNYEKSIYLTITDSAIAMGLNNKTAAVSASSDSAVTLSNCIFYNTTQNLVKRKANNVIESIVVTFPLMIALKGNTYTIENTKQVFNGFGYIGSVVWADKGIKYLRPNGKNADGTLNNIEATTDKLMLLNLSSLADTYQALVFDENNILGHTLGNYNPETNSWFSPYYSNAHWCGIGSFTLSSGVITGATFDGALNINSMCDGGWVCSSLTLASNVSSPTTTDIEYDLSSYLPNDGYNYEVIFSGTIQTGTTSGNLCRLDVKSSILLSSVHLCGVNTRTNSYMRVDGNATIPVGTDRKITYVHTSSNTGVFSLWAIGYRRIGTNA